jgi:hypothetical protein
MEIIIPALYGLNIKFSFPAICLKNLFLMTSYPTS